MTSRYNVDLLREQLQDAEKNDRHFNKALLKELDALLGNPVIVAGIYHILTESRLPPVTGPLPSNCTSCGKPLP